MTNKAKIIWIAVGTVAVSAGIWLWWRGKDAVPLTATPVMQQARATLASSAGASAPSGSVDPAGPDATQTQLSQIIPGYIPLPTISIT